MFRLPIPPTNQIALTIGFLSMDLWVALQETFESAEPHEQRFLGVYSSEQLALEVANLASFPDEGEVGHYVLDEVPDWIEGWVAELAAQEAQRPASE